MQKTYIFDFDSTIIAVECLEVLIAFATANHKDKEGIFFEISEITNAGMRANLPFSESLSRRFTSLRNHGVVITKDTLDICIDFLKGQLSDSIKANKGFFEENKGRIYVVSGGFKEIIVPVVKQLGIDEQHVLANRFLYDDGGVVVGYDCENILAKDEGKVVAVRALGLNGNGIMVGDGSTDFRVKEKGVVPHFFAFTENLSYEEIQKRSKIIQGADGSGDIVDFLNMINTLEGVRRKGAEGYRRTELVQESYIPFYGINRNMRK